MRAVSRATGPAPARFDRRVTHAVTVSLPAVVDALISIGRFAASRGWVPATSGNFSHRIDVKTIAVTKSGVDKGNMRAEDIAVLALDDAAPPGVSAETPLHLARYRADARIGAIVHVHTVAATVLSRLHAADGVLRLSGFEMHKALDGVTTHESEVMLPIFANAQDTVALARTVEETLGAHPAAPGYLLAGHGLYAWGATMDEARRHLEGLEFLLTCTLEERRLQR